MYMVTLPAVGRECTEVGKDGSRETNTEAYQNSMVAVEMDSDGLFGTCKHSFL